MVCTKACHGVAGRVWLGWTSVWYEDIWNSDSSALNGQSPRTQSSRRTARCPVQAEDSGAVGTPGLWTQVGLQGTWTCAVQPGRGTGLIPQSTRQLILPRDGPDALVQRSPTPRPWTGTRPLGNTAGVGSGVRLPLSFHTVLLPVARAVPWAHLMLGQRGTGSHGARTLVSLHPGMRYWQRRGAWWVCCLG